MLEGLIVEGVTGSGKTTLLRELQARLASNRPACTKLVLSEHYTERVLEDRKADGTLSVDDVLTHGGELVSLVDQLAGIQHGSKFADRSGNAAIVVLVERWLGTHVANLFGMQQTPSSGALDRLASQSRTLCDRGLSLVVLAMTEDMIRRRIAQTSQERNAEWRRYVESLGGTDAATKTYWEWQQRLLDFYDFAGVAYRRCDVSEDGAGWVQLVEELEGSFRRAG